MIYSASVHSVAYAKTRLKPRSDTFLLQVGSLSSTVEHGHRYFGIASTRFFDDIYATGRMPVFSLQQAYEMVSLLRRLNSSTQAIHIMICCDSGRTASMAIAKFIKSHYPRCKIHQPIDEQRLNPVVLSRLEIASHRGVVYGRSHELLAFLKRAMSASKKKIKTINRQAYKIRRRSLSANTTRLINKIKSEF